MAYEIVITAKAEFDLAEIERFISRDNPVAAAALCRELLSEVRSLREFPHRGAVLSHGRRALRKLVHSSYFIIYQIGESERRIDILRFWHTAQDRNRLRLRETVLAYHSEA